MLFHDFPKLLKDIATSRQKVCLDIQMYRGGRRKDMVWEFFTKINENGKVVAKCNKCGRTQSTKPCRMKTHQSMKDSYYLRHS